MWEGIDQSDEIDGLDGLSTEQLNAIKFEHAEKGVPADAQQQVDEQADRWHKEWGRDMEQEPIHWPEDLGGDLEQLLVEELLDAAQIFPNETGRGRGRAHPKAILRMSKSEVSFLVKILVDCERSGVWPDEVALVLIALLPRAE